MKTVNKYKIKSLIIKIHSYLGLFCFPYLLIFGLSSLSFNHHLDFLEIEGKVREEQQLHIQVPNISDNEKLAKAINDSSSIFGWYLPWSASRDSSLFFFETVKTGRFYETNFNLGTGEIRLVSRRSSIGHILKGLHGLGEKIPNAPLLVNLWQYYQDLTVYALLFWLLSGIWLWIIKPSSQRQVENAIMISFYLFSLLLMLYIWLIG